MTAAAPIFTGITVTRLGRRMVLSLPPEDAPARQVLDFAALAALAVAARELLESDGIEAGPFLARSFDTYCEEYGAQLEPEGDPSSIRSGFGSKAGFDFNPA